MARAISRALSPIAVTSFALAQHMARARTAGIGSQAEEAAAMAAEVATICTWCAAAALLALATTRALPTAQRASAATNPPDLLHHDLILKEKP